MNLIGLLVFILILTLVFGVLWWVVSLVAAKLPNPFGTVAQVVLALIFVLVLLGALFGQIAIPNFGVH